jgi:hypothetical protein
MRLPERYRSVVVLCELEGLSYLQAAGRLSLPLGTVQSRLARARKRLRGRLLERTQSEAPFIVGLGSARTTLYESLALARPPLAVVCTTCRMGELWVADRALFQSIVGRAIPPLIESGSRALAPPKLAGLTAILTSALVLSGLVLFQSRPAAQARQDNPRPSTESQPAARPSPRSLVTGGSATHEHVPAPKELKAAAGSGKILLYALDSEDNRIQSVDPDAKSRKRAPNRSQRSGMGGMMGGMTGGATIRRNRSRVEGTWKEVTREVHWAVVTGIVDHRAAQAAFSDAGESTPPPLDRIYRRVQLERQSRSQAGTWSNWERVEPEPTLEILDSLPEQAPEKTPEELRSAEALVDPLPHLTEGSWSGVDVERFVAKLPADQPAVPPGVLGEQAGRIRRPDPPVLMVRAFDFTAETGQTYRYRARLWFWTSGKWELRQARRSPDFHGRWSEPTNAATVP